MGLIIALHGVKQSGKDTTANFITEFAGESDPDFSVKRRGFADKGKLAFMRQFIPDITMENAIKIVDRFKEDPEAFITFPTVSLVGPQAFQGQITFRQALAQFHTEAARDIYGLDHWLDQLLHPNGVWEGEFDYTDINLITDLRFENEVHRIKKFGGLCVKIRRKDAEQAVIDQAAANGYEVHASELGLDDRFFDYIINNDDNDLVFAKKRTRDVWEDIRDNRL